MKTDLVYEEQKQNLLSAQCKADSLFAELKNRKLVRAGLTEQEVNNEVYKLADELFDIKKYWHKRIIRSGVNTLAPYHENPPSLMIAEDNLVIIEEKYAGFYEQLLTV
jgi:Xaa-Pro dipeptidase